MKCLFCDSKNISNSYLPSTYFNKKQFDYKQCNTCDLLFINPIPTSEDLEKMYPPSYQDGVIEDIQKDPYKKLIGLRFSYGYQFDLLRKLNFKGRMLDYGCGSANFLINSNYNNFPCDGAEYNPDHVAILAKEIKDSNFYTIDTLLSSDQKFDLIRLSNVFEHFTNPKETMEQLKRKLNQGGYFLIEGPIEYNFNFALQFRKIYFTLRKIVKPQYLANHTPTHIIFSNLKNQLNFFDDLGLIKVHHEVSEAEWPFPQSFSKAKGLISKLNVVIAKTSMLFSKLNRKWGNTFIYIGKI